MSKADHDPEEENPDQTTPPPAAPDKGHGEEVPEKDAQADVERLVERGPAMGF